MEFRPFRSSFVWSFRNMRFSRRKKIVENIQRMNLDRSKRIEPNEKREDD